ncbi:MAG: hypothetical protein KG029_18875 [Bacteroidetes bacterium]|nr:hypothetical protein [Bacteroidota bacterium]
MNGNGPLDFDATIDGSQFNAMLDEMQRRIRGTGDAAVHEGQRIDNTFRNIGVAMAAYFSAGQLSSFVTQVADVRGEFQQLEISFETMLKNKALSDKLMAEVVQFATTTPFDLKGVASGAKQLLAYGTAADDIITTMRQLGDVAAGLSIPFNDLVYLYGTSATQGKLMTKDLMQFAGRGIPIIDELSKILKVSKAEVMDLATKGEIHFGLLQEVIANLTNETGMFGNMMEKQSKSIAGLRSNLGDAWDNMLNDIGRANQETIEGTVRTAISVVENYQKVADILKVIIATYGAYKAAVMLNAVAMGKYTIALNLAIIKQNLLNIAQKANPYGLALAGITALVGGLWAYNRAIDESGKKMQEFNDSVSKSVSESNVLWDRLKKTTAGTEERTVAIRKLESIHGTYISNLNLEKAVLEDIEKAQKASNEEMIRTLAIKASNEEKLYWYERELAVIKEINKAGYDFNEILKERNNPKFDEAGRRIFVTYGNNVDLLLANYTEIQKQKKIIDETYQKIIDGFNMSLSTKPDEDFSNKIEEDKKTLSQKLKEIQQMYENYYRWVSRYGQQSADEQFENLIKGGKSYLEYLDAEIARLENKTKRSVSDTENLNLLIASRADLIGEESSVESFKKKIENTKEGFKDVVDYIEFIKAEIEKASKFAGSEQEIEKSKFLLEELASAEKQFVNDSLSTFQNLMKSSQDYAQQRLNAELEYQETLKKLDPESLGENYQKAIDEANKVRLKTLDDIKVKEAESLDAYKKLSGDLSRISRKEALDYVDILEDQLKVLDSQSEAYKLIKSLISDVKAEIKNTDVENLSEGLISAAYSLDKIVSLTSDANSGFAQMAAAVSSVVGELGNATRELNKAFKGVTSTSGTKKYDIDFASGLAGFTSIAGIFYTVSDALDKQWGTQRRIADIEQARLEYNTKVGFLIDELNEKLSKQLELLENMPTGQSFSPKASVLTESIKEAQKQLQGLLFSLQKTPKEINIQIPLDVIKQMTGVSDSLGALSKALADGIISQEQYDLGVEYINLIEDGTKRLNDLQKEYQEYITGTTSSALVDEIAQMFEEGKTMTVDFADSFESLMKKAILQGLKMRVLEPMLNSWLEEFSRGIMGGGMNSESWMAQLMMGLQDVGEAGNEFWENAMSFIERVFPDINDANNTTLSGNIKGITEPTAGILAGQMNAIRINQAHALTLMDNQLLELSKIEYNTRNNLYIKRIYDLIQSNQNNSVLRNRASGGS